MNIGTDHFYEVRSFLRKHAISEADAIKYLADIFQVYLAQPHNETSSESIYAGLMQRAYWVSLKQPGAWAAFITQCNKDYEIRNLLVRSHGFVGTVPADDLTSELEVSEMMGKMYSRGLYSHKQVEVPTKDGSVNYVQIIQPSITHSPETAAMLSEAILGSVKDDEKIKTIQARMPMPGVGFWFLSALVEAVPMPGKSPRQMRRYASFLNDVGCHVCWYLRQYCKNPDPIWMMTARLSREHLQATWSEIQAVALYATTINEKIRHKLFSLAPNSPSWGNDNLSDYFMERSDHP